MGTTVIDVRIEGLVSLLQHRRPNPDEETEPPDTREVTGKRDRTKEAERSLYQLDDGTLYQPSDHVHGALLKAAVNFQIPGRGKKTYKDLINSALIIDPDCIPHVHSEWIPDGRWARVQRSQIWRVRPKLPKWALEFTLTVTDEQLPISALRQILDHAGRYVGIGDFRPKFGRFSVTSWQVNEGAK